MDSIKPRINLAGYQKALQEYGNDPSRIIEELVANSYDADATVVFIVHSEKALIVVDNGTGISDDQFPQLLDLGAGSKIEAHESNLKRSYLGSFGFGVKATINVSRTISITTVNSVHRLACSIDVPTLRSHGFKSDWEGFQVESGVSSKSQPTGTAVHLSLSNDLTPAHVKSIQDSLYNLPKSEDFAVYLVEARLAGKAFTTIDYKLPGALKQLAKVHAKYRVAGTLEIGLPKLTSCPIAGTEKIDVAVWCKGLDANLKVPTLGQFAGVYVKVDGRVLKRNFQGEKVLDGISKYPKFKHGMRVEVPVDWLKNQISLGRDGLQFGNDSSKKKFENELKLAVSAAVRPFAKQLEAKKTRRVSKAVDLRMKKAAERIAKKKFLKPLEKTGFAFQPTDDYEMALTVANPVVLKALNPDWLLMDFNGQLDFDCLVYDRVRAEYLRVELEPRLEAFLAQGVPGNIEAIITWTLGEWKVGKTKKGKKAHYELAVDKDGVNPYRLLVRASAQSKEPKQVLPVYCIEEIVKDL